MSTNAMLREKMHDALDQADACRERGDHEGADAWERVALAIMQQLAQDLRTAA